LCLALRWSLRTMDGGNEDDLYPIAILIDELKVRSRRAYPTASRGHVQRLEHTGGWNGYAMGRQYAGEAAACAVGWWSVAQPSPGLTHGFEWRGEGGEGGVDTAPVAHDRWTHRSETRQQLSLLGSPAAGSRARSAKSSTVGSQTLVDRLAMPSLRESFHTLSAAAVPFAPRTVVAGAIGVKPSRTQGQGSWERKTQCGVACRVAPTHNRAKSPGSLSGSLFELRWLCWAATADLSPHPLRAWGSDSAVDCYTGSASLRVPKGPALHWAEI
jgi:hypothetical protein